MDESSAYPGTTCPLFSVRQRKSLMSSCETLSPISFCMFSCHRNTSWFARLSQMLYQNTSH